MLCHELKVFLKISNYCTIQNSIFNRANHAHTQILIMHMGHIQIQYHHLQILQDKKLVCGIITILTNVNTYIADMLYSHK